jgi:UDP-glucose 4-epimerase
MKSGVDETTGMIKEAQNNSQDNVLVTGGAGFIGSHVAKELIKMGYRVTILDDLSGGFVSNLPPEAVFIKGSVVDERLIESIFEQYHFTYVFHLAAYAAEGLSHFIRRFNYRNNLIGSVNLINESIKNEVKCFVFTSSIAVYGEGQAPFKEDTAPKPEDPYGISKLAVEMDLMNAHKMFGLNSIIFRPHNVYGENQNIGDKYRNVIGIFLNRMKKGQTLPVFGDGSQTRAFSYISDVAGPIAHSIEISEAYNQIFNIGGDQPYSVKFLAELIREQSEQGIEIEYLEARNEVLHAWSDHSKARRVFGKQMRNVPIEEGLKRMIHWVDKVETMEPTKFEGIEIEKNLPEFWRR